MTLTQAFILAAFAAVNVGFAVWHAVDGRPGMAGLHAAVATLGILGLVILS